MPGEHDRQETDADEQLAIRVLSDAHGRFVALPDDLPSPTPGSPLFVERSHTAREPIDAMVISQRSKATDNLGRLFSLMLDESNARVLAYPYSGYSLIRTAIESAAVGLWLIEPNRKAARVLRALQRAHQHEADALDFIKLIGDDDVIRAARERYESVHRRLVQLKDTVGPLRQRVLGMPPSYTAILKSLTPTPPGVPHEVTSPVVAWKISSAFIHGSETVIRSLSDIRQLTGFVEGIATFEITPSLRLTAGIAATCVAMLERLDARYLELATRTPSGRPLPASD